ncbi:MAG: FecR family protein [Draconibacterium sp.]
MEKKFKISKEEKRAIVNYLSGDFSAADSVLLNEWLSKSQQNRMLFDQLSDIWKSSLPMKKAEEIDTEKAWIELQNHLQSNTIRTIGWKRILSTAAALILMFLLGGFGYYFLDRNKGNEILQNQYVEFVSPLGSRSFVQLTDGSKVWLNAGSTLKYKNTFGTSDRELQLTGEGFFEVSKNKELPFIVKTSEINVIAVGTKFNVKAYSEEKTIETTLVEGSVKLESSTVKLADNLFLKPNEKAVFTRKNQQLDLFSQGDKVKGEAVKPKLEIMESIQPEPIISWKDKRWVISNEKLGDLAKKLERRFEVNFIFDNDVLKEYSFRGTLEDESLEQIMEAIRFSSPIKYVIEDKTVYVMADGQKMDKFRKLLTQ